MALSFEPLALPGLVLVTSAAATDERGAFARSWCRDEFAAAGLDFTPCQLSLSENHARHTLRGMHWQVAPGEEVKLVRCIRGAVHDVILDLRPASANYGRHVGVELSAGNRRALLVPRGCAHGFLTLTEDAVVEYMMDVPFAPGCGRGLRWNDPAFGLQWPAPPAVISARDAGWPDHG